MMSFIFEAHFAGLSLINSFGISLSEWPIETLLDRLNDDVIASFFNTFFESILTKKLISFRRTPKSALFSKTKQGR